ncbi:uncharacterized protein LOC136042123 isoform X2 [Artemia franciscana]|uniref:Uncharacterized protein n=1 Tax=Artemia franciscana TaxID=6661 RepID=A0AA88KUT3_ARTSF|nr:hypothetical protein QYM36_018364 [Artemia franciscana]
MPDATIEKGFTTVIILRTVPAMAKTAPFFVSTIAFYVILMFIQRTQANPMQRLFQRRLGLKEPSPAYHEFAGETTAVNQEDPTSESPALSREMVQAVVGAATGDENCLLRTACYAGTYARTLSGKEIVFMMLERFVPPAWQRSYSALRSSAMFKEDCAKIHKCVS